MSSCPPPCPPPTPDPCAQVCHEPPVAPCRVKPIMRGLHWSQTTSKLAQAFALAATGGSLWYFLYVRPKVATYADFYRKGEFDDWGDEMARKGLFQAVPKESMQDNKHAK